MMIEQKKILDFFFSGVDEVVPEGGWITQKELEDTIERVSESLERDYTLAEERLSFVFGADGGAEQSNRETLKLVQDWHAGRDMFSATAMVIVAMEHLGFSGQDNSAANESLNERLIQAMLAASALGEVANNLPYHNNLHFRKVLMHVLRMIVAHNNKIFSDTTHRLSKMDMAKLIIAACIHDIGHEGKGNIVDHKYHMAMIEKRSFSYAYPYLKAAGLDEDTLADIKVMLITTDVSPLGDDISPVNQLRVAYEYHFGMAEEVDDGEEEETPIADELCILMEDSHLCLLCVMLQEADIMNSVGVDYNITRFESVAISKEIGLSHSLPEDTLLFLESICSRKLLSDAARYLAEDNFAVITQRVFEDYRDGNNPYDE